jgi:acetate kinase
LSRPTIFWNSVGEKRNANNEEIISRGKSNVTIRVIKTNEELMTAKLVCDLLNYSPKKIKLF